VTVEKGDRVADFELLDEDGAPQRLSKYLALGPVVLFFYPAAMSRGCTAESCHFRDLAAEFSALGAQPIGISADGVGKQQEFSKRYSLGYPLLSDRDGAVAAQFGVKRRFGPVPVKRWTFVIGGDGRVLEVIKSETRMTHHADRALEVLGQHHPARPRPSAPR
jgi:thioredoxin-dependent peroxiredoxin